MQKRVLVTGATGFIGGHVINALLKDGWEVKCLIRDAQKGQQLPKEVRKVEGNLLNFSILETAVKGCDSVIHLAGAVKADSRREFFSHNSDGVSNLLKAAREGSPERFILCSSLAAMGPSTTSEPRKPNDTPEPITIYGESKLAGEEVMREKGGDIWWNIIRPPAVYGPGDTSFLPLFKMVKRRLKVKIGEGSIFSLIYVLDLAQAFVDLLNADISSGNAFFVTDNIVHTEDALNDAIEEGLGVNAKNISVPPIVMNAVAGLNEIFCGAMGKTPFLSREKVYEITRTNYTCDDTSFRDAVDFVHQYDLQEGIENTIDWYIKHQWL